MPPKRPNPKKDKSARRRRPGSPGTFSTGIVDPDGYDRRERMTVQATDAPPESAISVLVTNLWVGSQIGDAANHCVDACRTIGFALAQFGIRTELRAAEVVMRDSRTGMLRRVAPRIPSWKGNLLDGHCILTLPDEGRHIDATIEQFPGISHLRLGPAVGRSGGYLTPDGRMVAVGSTTSRIPPGAQLAIQRGPYMMLYTLADEPANQIITSSEHVRPHAELHRRAGINLASLTLAGLRSPNLNRLARQTSYRRLHALLDALGDSPHTSDSGDVRFTFTEDGGGSRALLLDEIALPPGTPPEAPVL